MNPKIKNVVLLIVQSLVTALTFIPGFYSKAIWVEHREYLEYLDVVVTPQEKTSDRAFSFLGAIFDFDINSLTKIIGVLAAAVILGCFIYTLMQFVKKAPDNVALSFGMFFVEFASLLLYSSAIKLNSADYESFSLEYSAGPICWIMLALAVTTFVVALKKHPAER